MSKIYFQEFASVLMHYGSKSLTMYMVWHKREHIDPESQWLRQKIETSIEDTIKVGNIGHPYFSPPYSPLRHTFYSDYKYKFEVLIWINGFFSVLLKLSMIETP